MVLERFNVPFGAPAVGLDIDCGAIKAVQIGRSAGSHTLQHVGYRKLKPGAIADGEVADQDLLAYELKTAPAKAALDRPARARAARIRQVMVRSCLTVAETCRHRKGSVVLSSVARWRQVAKAQRGGLSAKGQRSCC
jgi:Tfp pilus assembly PilM family ATPase